MMDAKGYDYNGIVESTSKSGIATPKICIDRTQELLSEIEKLKKEKDELMSYCRSYVDNKVAETKAEALREAGIVASNKYCDLMSKYEKSCCEDSACWHDCGCGDTQAIRNAITGEQEKPCAN